MEYRVLKKNVNLTECTCFFVHWRRQKTSRCHHTLLVYKQHVIAKKAFYGVRVTAFHFLVAAFLLSSLQCV